MKLIFKKDENSQIKVFQKVDGNQKDFSYVEMIKTLIATRSMADPEISGSFTDAEKVSIKSMVDHINKAVSEAKEAD